MNPELLLRMLGLKMEDLDPARILDHPATEQFIDRIARRVAERLQGDGAQVAALEPPPGEEE